jgi:hypothetical protein
MFDLLFDIYDKGFEPPYWVKTFPFTKKEMKKSICYYDSDDNLSQVKKIESKREPVNIAMTRYYNLEKMKKYFGYSISNYNIDSPNIAVYCYTPCIVENKPLIKIHVLNVIGIALDSKKQPDFFRIEQKGLPEYIKMMWKVFKKIRHCFVSKNFNVLVLHGFGLGVFSYYAKEFNIDSKRVFQCCFDYIFADISIKKKIIFNFLDLPTKISVTKIKIPIQELVFELETEKTLFINAWDPFSIIGNGNSNDNSLDGYFGRMTAMSVMGWSNTNPNLRFEPVL